MQNFNSTLDLVDALYLASILGNQPRLIDRYIDYFGGGAGLNPPTRRARRPSASGGLTMTLLRALLIASLMLTAGVAGDAWAAAPADQVRVQIDRVVKVLADPGLRAAGRERERQATVRKIAEEIFDLGEMTRRTLGQHWQGRTEAERAEVVTLFADLLERGYFTRVAAYSDEKITVLGDSIDGDLAKVRTRIVTHQGTQIPVDYRMIRRGDRWMIYDVSIEGVSLVANYRAQFNKIIQTSSYQTLVDKLRSKRG
jgi:phospholipid transport system substrate-binding protein